MTLKDDPARPGSGTIRLENKKLVQSTALLELSRITAQFAERSAEVSSTSAFEVPRTGFSRPPRGACCCCPLAIVDDVVPLNTPPVFEEEEPSSWAGGGPRRPAAAATKTLFTEKVACLSP